MDTSAAAVAVVSASSGGKQPNKRRALDKKNSADEQLADEMGEEEAEKCVVSMRAALMDAHSKQIDALEGMCALMAGLVSPTDKRVTDMQADYECAQDTIDLASHALERAWRRKIAIAHRKAGGQACARAKPCA